jgi:outer membrane protein TolC
VAAGTAGVDSARALADSAGRLPDPALIVGIENLPVSGPDAYSTTRDFMTMRKVGVMQTFRAREKRNLQHARAEAEADLADAQLAATQLDVARETAAAWIALASANASLDALRHLQPEVELGASAARASVASGRASAAEALTAEAAVARLKSRVLEMQSEERQAQVALARWIGEAATRPLAPLPPLDELPVSAETLVTTTHLHASIRPLDARLAAARADVELARAERHPDWSVEASFAKRGPDFSDMASIQFTVGLPLFAKHRQNPVIAARSADVRRITAERDAEIQMHTAELQQMVIEWQQLGEQLSQYDKELLPLARERSQASLASYRAGTSDLKTLVDALEDESSLFVDRAGLQAARGRAWTNLRYLETQHLHLDGSHP